MSIQPDIDWIVAHISPEEIRGKHVLEVGSRNWTGVGSGNLEPVITHHIKGLWPASYTGIDRLEGLNVTDVLDVCEAAESMGFWRYDAIFSVAMLEHVQNWQLAVENMVALLKPGGTIWISSNTPGFGRHAYPDDYWRFLPETLRPALGLLDPLVIEVNEKYNVINVKGVKAVLAAVPVP